MKKEYITPRCKVELLHEQYLMLGVSKDDNSYDSGNSDKSKGFSTDRDFWTGESPVTQKPAHWR
jgi:hypothetical protein